MSSDDGIVLSLVGAKDNLVQFLTEKGYSNRDFNSSDLNNNVDDVSDDGIWEPLLASAAIFLGLHTLVMTLVKKSDRYLDARSSLETSQEFIQNQLSRPPEIRDNFWRRRMKEHVKMRDEAAAYIKEHKFIGKLVEVFYD